MTVCGLLNFQRVFKFFKMNLNYLTNMIDFCCLSSMLFNQTIFSLLILSIVFIIGSLIWVKFYPGQKFFSRKALHVVSIYLLSIAVESINADDVHRLIHILLVIEILLLFAVNYGFFYSEGRKSWGIVYFLPPTILLLLLGPNHINQISSHLIQISICLKILAISDGFSAILGRLFENIFEQNLRDSDNTVFWKNWIERNKIKWGGDSKTLIGSIVFFLTSIIILSQIILSVQWILFIAFVLASIELISGRGSDNFFIPLLSFVLMQFALNHQYVPIENWMVGFVGFILLMFVNSKFKWLSQSGFVFAAILGSFVLMNGMSIWPMVVFLLLGTMVGKLNKTDISDVKHSKPRDAFQVLANGGGVLLIICVQTLLGPEENLHTFMLVSVAAACSDTLSSELGMRYGKKAYNLFTLKEVAKGLSGGVSLPGFIGAFIGAFAIALFAEHDFSVVLFWGMIGSVIDSILGLIFQAKYLKDGQLSDRNEGELVKGFSFITNDFVNFASNVLVLILFILSGVF